jgi:type VI secretion system protein ImpB
MPILKVMRSGVQPAARKVPTSTTMTVLPMTPDRAGQELSSVEERPVLVDSLKDAFEKFKPELKFSEEIQGTQFEADLAFRNLRDFDPENLQKRQEDKDKSGKTIVRRNDLADLKSQIDVLYQVKTMWSRLAVQRAWGNEGRRQEIVDALKKLHLEVARLAPPDVAAAVDRAQGLNGKGKE